MARKKETLVKVEFIQVGRGNGIEHVLRTFDDKRLVHTNDNSAFSLDVSDRGPVLVGKNTPTFLAGDVVNFSLIREGASIQLKSYEQVYEVSHGVVLNLNRSFYMISSFYDAVKDKTLLRLEMSNGFVENARLIDIIRLTRITGDKV